MKISKAELLKMGACEDGLGRFIKQTNNTDEPVDVSSLLDGYNTYSDLLWLASKTVDKSKIVRFACDCALINIELIKPYTKQYDTIVEFLNNPIVDTTDIAVYAAAHAAAARAARAARAAVNAYNAANAASNAAAYAAAYAAVNVYNAANAASHAADAANAASHAADAANAANAVYAANAAYAAYAANAAYANDKVNELIIKLFED